MKIDPFIEHLAAQYNSPAFIDSVGTSAIFGEVVSCAVMITAPFDMYELDDSKKLKHCDIYRLAQELKNRVIYSIGIANVSEIKRFRSTVKADFLAMRRAVKSLSIKPDVLFIDGKYAIKTDIPVYTVIRGDSCVFGIAVASIIAKDYRDHMIMKKYGRKYSKYGISSNKGYRSPSHLTAIKLYGATSLHRSYMPQIQRLLNG